jgi:hypothetical protein
MCYCLTQTKPKARKRHVCKGRLQVSEYLDSCEVTTKCGGISKGDTYINQKNVDGGTVYTWKSCQVCFDLIQEHKLFDHY